MPIVRMGTDTRMSEIVIHNKTIYLCGQVAKDENTPIKEQTKTMLDSVEDLLKKAGSDKKHIVSAIIYLKDIRHYAAMNEVWDAWLIPGYAPARACVEARLADPDLLVEVSVIAAVIEQ